LLSLWEMSVQPLKADAGCRWRARNDWVIRGLFIVCIWIIHLKKGN